MNNIAVVLLIVAIIGDQADAQWMTVEQFTPSELTNLTQRQEHKLMLRALANRGDAFLAMGFYFEMLSKNIGNKFYGFPQDRHAIRDNNAIIRASFESIKKLFLQDKIESIITKACLNAARYVLSIGSYPVAFSLMCSDLDYFLKNETSYTALRDKYKYECLLPLKKTYHYGIAKSLQEEVQMVEELLNDPKMKLLMAHHAWVWINHSYNSTLKNVKSAILKLANVPGKLEQVQEIYEQTVEEIVPLMKHIDYTIIQAHAKELYFDYLQSNLTSRLWNKIIQNITDWKDYFECDPISDSSSTKCGRKQLPRERIFTDAWPVTSDFTAIELGNLTLQQEHDLFLQKMAKKSAPHLQQLIILELLAKYIGNDFFSFIENEEMNIQHNAIVKASFDCISNLLLQTRVLKTLIIETKNISEYVANTGDFEKGFSQFCENVDEKLKNETFYMTQKDQYIKQHLSLPGKIYQYSIGKPSEDQRLVVLELVNNFQIRRFWAHQIWTAINSARKSKFEYEISKYAILEMAQLPSKAEAIQMIYNETVEEIVLIMKNITYKNVLSNLNQPGAFVATYEIPELYRYAVLLVQRMVKNINKYPDLEIVFKAFTENYKMSVVSPDH